MTAGSGCAWTAASDSAWLGVTGGASGSANGTVAYSVDANPTTAQRIGRLTIAGKTFTFTQAGATCSYALSPHHADGCGCCRDGIAQVTAGTRMLADGVELSVVADHHLRRHRLGERNGQLQHRRQLVFRGTLGDVDRRLGHVQRDAERVLHLHHLPDEPCVRRVERDEHRHRGRSCRLFVDRNAFGDVDNHQQRRERQRERHCEIQRCRLHWIVVTDWHPHGRRSGGHDYPVSCCSPSGSVRPAYHQQGVSSASPRRRPSHPHQEECLR